MNDYVLKLSLTYAWFDMIKSGEKKEEYRDKSPWFMNRLTQFIAGWGGMYKTPRIIEFSRGYTNIKMFVECYGSWEFWKVDKAMAYEAHKARSEAAARDSGYILDPLWGYEFGDKVALKLGKILERKSL